jgi:LysR family glycine cleavage system transcriptional activator
LLLPAVTNAFGEIAAATALMKQPETRGEITVTCVPALLSLWLIPRLNTFTDQFPGVRVTLIASNDPENLRLLDTDVSVLYGDGSWPDCWTRLWSQLRLFPVASPTLLNSRPLRSVRDLADHTLFHGDDGREWNTWLSAADAVDVSRGRQHFMSDARLSTEAALHGQGIALGDTITASNLIARGELVVPFDLTVPANDAFYVACRQSVRQTPIVKVFIDWLFASLEESMPEPQTSARMVLRGRGARAPETYLPISAPAKRRTASTPQRKTRA